MNKSITLADKVTVGDYTYYRTSDWWKDKCSHIFCFQWIEWPSYGAASQQVTIQTPDGPQHLVIQCWKGWCADLFQHVVLPPEWGLSKVSFPGGVGAEVGIYNLTKPEPHRLLGSAKFDYLPESAPIENWAQSMKALWDRLREQVKQPTAWKRWWPDVDIVKSTGHEVSFTLRDPRFDAALITSFHTDTYWTCEWMDEASYNCWRKKNEPTDDDHDGQLKAPKDVNPDEYSLEFSFDGVEYIWPEGTGAKIWKRADWDAWLKANPSHAKRSDAASDAAHHM